MTRARVILRQLLVATSAAGGRLGPRNLACNNRLLSPLGCSEEEDEVARLRAQLAAAEAKLAAVQKSGAETALVGVRVVTDVKGSVASVVGIASEAQQVTLTVGQAAAVALKVAPNEVWAIGQDGKAALQKATPFVAPHG